jgi:hypothetical protein
MPSKAQSKRLTDRLEQIRERASSEAANAKDGSLEQVLANLAEEAAQLGLELAEEK